MAFVFALQAAVVPSVGIATLGAGAFVGSYDLSRFAVASVTPRPRATRFRDPQDVKEWAGFAGVTAGASAGVLTYGLRELFFGPQVPPVPRFDFKAAGWAQKIVYATKQMAHYTIHFPYRFRLLGVFLAGSVAGVTHTVVQRSYEWGHVLPQGQAALEPTATEAVHAAMDEDVVRAAAPRGSVAWLRSEASGYARKAAALGSDAWKRMRQSREAGIKRVGVPGAEQEAAAAALLEAERRQSQEILGWTSGAEESEAQEQEEEQEGRVVEEPRGAEAFTPWPTEAPDEEQAGEPDQPDQPDQQEEEEFEADGADRHPHDR